MKKLIIEIFMIVVFSSLIGFVYIIYTGKDISLLGKANVSENLVDDIFDSQGEVTFKEKNVNFEILQRYLNDDRVLIIDARDPMQYSMNRIGDAINIYPYDEQSEYMNALISLPNDKVIIVYCDGGTCDSSHRVAQDLASFGFERVYVYTGGWEDWEQNSN